MEPAPAKAGADDTVVGFEHRSDAELFLAQLRIRMAEFALELLPEKTRLIPGSSPGTFGRRAASDKAARGDGKPETPAFAGAGCLTSWALLTSVRARGWAASSLPGTRGAIGNGQSC